MTTKKRATPVEKAQEAEDLDAWQKLQSLGTGLQVLVRRQPGGKYLEIVALDGFDEEIMRERYGGGKFTLHPRKDGSYIKGKGQIQTVDIEGAPKMFPAASVDGTNPEIQRLNAQIEKLTADDGPSESMIVAMTTLIAPVLAAITTALMDRPAPAAPPDPIEMFNVLRKMTRDDRDYLKDNANASGLDPIVEKLGLPLLGEITKLREQGAANGTTPAPNPALPPGSPATAPATAPPTTLPELAAFVARWCAPHCSRGTSPTLRAELFLEELSLQDPDGLMESVIELSRVPDVLTHWERLVPEVALNRDWHGAFIEEIRILADLADEAQPAPAGEAGADQGADDPEGGRGDESDASGDGAPIAAGVAE